MSEVKAMNKVVHFEIPVENIDKAKEFYNIFNWEIIDYPNMDYAGVRTTPVDENHMPEKPGAINGGMMKKTDQVSMPVVAIEVESIDNHVKKALSKGGKLIREKFEIHGMGYYCYIADPEGTVLGLWQPL